jgi:hypothetical protein
LAQMQNIHVDASMDSTQAVVARDHREVSCRDERPVGAQEETAEAEVCTLGGRTGSFTCEGTDGRDAAEGRASVANPPCSIGFSSAGSDVARVIPLIAVREPMWVWLSYLIAFVVLYTGEFLHAACCMLFYVRPVHW